VVPAYDLPVPELERVKIRIEPHGYLRILRDAYTYVRRWETSFPGDCPIEGESAHFGEYVPLELTNISRSSDLALLPYRNCLLVAHGGRVVVNRTDEEGGCGSSDDGLAEYSVRFQGRAANRHYFVLDSVHYGNGRGWCGGRQDR